MKHFGLSILFLLLATALQAQPTFAWAEKIGGANGDYGNSVVADNSGNIISTGLFIGTVDFDPGAGTYNLSSSSMQGNTYIQKVDAAGALIWARSFSGGTHNIGNGIECDNAGNIYICGSFNGTVDFDPSAAVFNASSVSGADVFIVKLTSSGNFVWVRTYSSGGASGDGAWNIDASGNNHLVVVGSIYGNCDFDPGPGVMMVTSLDSLTENIFVMKLDSAGQTVWARGITGANWQEADDVQCDVNGNVYVVGQYTDTVDFDPGPGVYDLIPSNSSYEGFILVLDPNGNFIRAQTIASPSASVCMSVTVSSNGDATIAGHFWGTTDFDPGSGVYNLVSTNQGSLFVMRLDASGNLLWAISAGGNGGDLARTITEDSQANIYVAGEFQSTVDFDPGPATYNLISNSFSTDVFFLKLTSSGNFVWATQLGSNMSDYCFSITTFGTAVITTGRFDATADFDPQAGVFSMTPSGSDAFVMKYTQCLADTNAVNTSACYSYTLNNQSYSASGSYYQNLLSVNGCDSVVQLNLTIDTVNTGVSMTGATLTASASSATYQWISCETQQPIVGATSQSFSPSLNGTYAVIVTQNNCTDTSACQTVLSVAITEQANEFSLSPNPSNGVFELKSAQPAECVEVYSANGDCVYRSTTNESRIDLSAYANGIYLLRMKTAAGWSSARLIKL